MRTVDETTSTLDELGARPATTASTQVREDIATQSRPRYGDIHCGDCIQVMSTLPEESIRVVVTSPPYNLKNSTGNGMKDGRGGKWSNAALLDGYDTHEDAMPHDAYVR
ncbi:MAG: hypothetical protein AAF471_07435, partial [Myxococcota bacterium]